MTVSNGVNLGRSLCDYELGIQICISNTKNIFRKVTSMY